MVMLRVGQAWCVRFSRERGGERRGKRTLNEPAAIHGLPPIDVVSLFGGSAPALLDFSGELHRVAQHADLLDLAFDDIARQAVARRGHEARLGHALAASSLSADQAVPAGVPVMMTMPGLSVKLREKKWISSAQVQIMFAVLLDCRSSPLIRDCSLSSADRRSHRR